MGKESQRRGLPRAHRREVRVCVALDEPDASRIVAMLDENGDYKFLAEAAESADLVSLLETDEYDVYLVDGLMLGPGIVPPETARAATIVAVHQGLEGEAEQAVNAGAVDSISRGELLPVVLGRVLRYALLQSQMRTSLRESEARHALTLAAANDGLWEWDLAEDRLRVSSRWTTLLDVTEEELGHTAEDWFSRVHPDDLGGLRADLQAHIDGRTPRHQFEHRVRQRDGRFRWVLGRGLVRRDSWGRPLGLAGSLTDISHRKRVEEQEQSGRFVDELTGLASRRALIEALEAEIERSHQSSDIRYAVLFMNLDRFKVVNDSIGLESGDQILLELGERLNQTIGDSGLVCRYGGDEFAILLTDLDEGFSAAASTADAIHDSLRRPFDLDGTAVFTTASIGVTLCSSQYQRAAEVLRDAGVATNKAKRLGKSQTSVFDANMRVEAVNVLRLQNALRQAVNRQEFEVFYQPIVTLSDQRLSGFEALVRWNHPRRGTVGPIEFIPLAEETGLIVPIGLFVLNEACRQMSDWRRKLSNGSDLTVSVNLSGRQLSSPTLLTDIERILGETGLDPSALKLELTESTLIDDPDTAASMLSALRDRGIRLYIDDFGTGYSSLSYIHRFAVDGLKIDKSFVEMVGRPDRKAAIVPSIVGLAHNLGIGVVAEGVEDPGQARALRALHCAEAQGYLYSRPVPRDGAESLIEKVTLGNG